METIFFNLSDINSISADNMVVINKNTISNFFILTPFLKRNIINNYNNFENIIKKNIIILILLFNKIIWIYYN